MPRLASCPPLSPLRGKRCSTGSMPVERPNNELCSRRILMKLRSKLLFAGVVVGGVAVFASSSSPTGLSEVADVPQVYSPPVNYDTSDGLRVQTIRLNADRRTVNIRLNQSDHSKMSIAYGIELSTDRGESVLPPSVSAGRHGQRSAPRLLPNCRRRSMCRSILMC